MLYARPSGGPERRSAARLPGGVIGNTRGFGPRIPGSSPGRVVEGRLKAENGKLKAENGKLKAETQEAPSGISVSGPPLQL